MKAFFLLITIITLTACRRDEIEVRQAPKEDASAAPAPAMGMGQIEAPPHPASGLKWTLPSGWKEEPGNGIRLATLVPPQDAGKSEMSIVALPGDVGGELANVNRWRGQLSLPPIDAGRLPQARQTLNSRLGTMMVYDFTGEGSNKSRMIVGAVKVDDTTWFFKLTGDEKAAGKHKPAFIKLLEGLKKNEA